MTPILSSAPPQLLPDCSHVARPHHRETAGQLHAGQPSPITARTLPVSDFPHEALSCTASADHPIVPTSCRFASRRPWHPRQPANTTADRQKTTVVCQMASRNRRRYLPVSARPSSAVAGRQWASNVGLVRQQAPTLPALYLRATNVLLSCTTSKKRPQAKRSLRLCAAVNVPMRRARFRGPL